MDFQRGAYSPDGKVEMSSAEIEAHNRELAVAEIEQAKQTGRAVFYFFPAKVCADGFKRDFVGTWEGSFKFQVCNVNTSRNNWGAKRTDMWFVGPDGKTWHGVNIGDNDILRCKRIKG
jgi:hypothetical protein